MRGMCTTFLGGTARSLEAAHWPCDLEASFPDIPPTSRAPTNVIGAKQRRLLNCWFRLPRPDHRHRSGLPASGSMVSLSATCSRFFRFGLSALVFSEQISQRAGRSP